MDKRILVINPGSTSTKLALFQGEQKLFDAAVRHSKEDLSPFSWVMEQADFRQTAIEKELSAHNVDLTTLDAVCARGGQLPYCAAGTYLVDQDMVDFMYTVRDAAHASNLGCVLALRIARPLGIPAFICDPVTVDEMTDEARLSGHPVLPRMMTGHALNCRAMALRCAADVLHKPLADCRLIVLHLGGGGSARLSAARWWTASAMTSGCSPRSAWAASAFSPWWLCVIPAHTPSRTSWTSSAARAA